MAAVPLHEAWNESSSHLDSPHLDVRIPQMAMPLDYSTASQSSMTFHEQTPNGMQNGQNGQTGQCASRDNPVYRTSPQSMTSAMRTLNQHADRLGEPSLQSITGHDKHLQLTEELIFQVRELRRENSRRCVVYIAIATLACALFFTYLDRVERRIRILCHQIHNNYSSHPEKPSQISGAISALL